MERGHLQSGGTPEGRAQYRFCSRIIQVVWNRLFGLCFCQQLLQESERRIHGSAQEQVVPFGHSSDSYLRRIGVRVPAMGIVVMVLGGGIVI